MDNKYDFPHLVMPLGDFRSKNTQKINAIEVNLIAYFSPTEGTRKKTKYSTIYKIKVLVTVQSTVTHMCIISALIFNYMRTQLIRHQISYRCYADNHSSYVDQWFVITFFVPNYDDNFNASIKRMKTFILTVYRWYCNVHNIYVNKSWDIVKKLVKGRYILGTPIILFYVSLVVESRREVDHSEYIWLSVCFLSIGIMDESISLLIDRSIKI